VDILRAVTELAFEEEEDQFGLVRPSYHGYKHCLRLLIELLAMDSLLKPSDITTDNNGDIRISWANGGKEAELICPFQGLPYVYFSSAQGHGTEAAVIADKIAERSRWAMDGK